MLVERMAAVAEVERDVVAGGIAQRILRVRGNGRAFDHVVAHGRDHRVGHRQHLGPRSEEHTSELQSLMRISYAVFCLKTKPPLMKYDSQSQTHRPQTGLP